MRLKPEIGAASHAFSLAMLLPFAPKRQNKLGLLGVPCGRGQTFAPATAYDRNELLLMMFHATLRAGTDENSIR